MSRYMAQHRQPQQSYMLRRGGVGLIAFGVVASTVVPAHACGLAAPAVQDEGTGSVSSSFQPDLASAPEVGGTHYLVPQAEGTGEQFAYVGPAMGTADNGQPVVAPDVDSARSVVFDQPEAVQSGPLDVASMPAATVPLVATVATTANTITSTMAPVAQTQQSTQVSTNTVYEARRDQIVRNALAGIGGSYVWGGHSYRSWDCAGFVSYVYGQSGISLDSYTYSMKNQLVQTTTPKPGDVVFANGFSHVGIYLGNGKMVSALNPAQGTTVTSVDGGGLMHVDGYFTAPGL